MNATYIRPTEGRAGWVCGFVIPKTTQHYDLALDYIDASISAEVGASLIDEYFLGHPNLDALKLADPKNVKTLQLDQMDVRERTRFAAPLTDEQREAFNRIWAGGRRGRLTVRWPPPEPRLPRQRTGEVLAAPENSQPGCAR